MTKKYLLDNKVWIEKTSEGLQKLSIATDLAAAEIYLHGAHLTHYQPHGQSPVIFDAQASRVTPPKAVHAGIPICWPWFGPHPTDSSKPQHGFVRDRVWILSKVHALADEEIEVILSLKSNAHTQALFDFSFELELTFTIGNTLTLSLKTTNLDTKSFTITQALHTYFAISHLSNVQIKGVENCSYVDYTDHKIVKKDKEALIVQQEVNRVYVPSNATVFIEDSKAKRTIVVSKSGSHSTTIWNPWVENGIHDLKGDAYNRFVCVETTNALEDAVSIAPQRSHTITQHIALK